MINYEDRLPTGLTHRMKPPSRVVGVFGKEKSVRGVLASVLYSVDTFGVFVEISSEPKCVDQI
jgi:hypothetical protein